MPELLITYPPGPQMLRNFFLAAASTAILFASEATDPVVIPSDLTSNFFYADGQVLRAQSALNAAQQERNLAFNALTEFCGPKAKPEINQKDHRKFVCTETKN
jgi:hypothetical protein